MLKHEKGATLIMTAALILPLLGIAVLAFDVGRIFIVRNEMQNAADAAALAGANCLDRQSLPGSATDCTNAKSATLNWTRGSAKATDQLSNNTADNVAISTTDSGHEIEVGYWNLQSGSPSGGALSTTFSPLTIYDKPAVRVILTKDTGKNNGPITMLTRMMFSGADVPMTAMAVAVISSPGNVPPSSLIPQVINECMYDKFWDKTTGTPKIFNNTDIDPYGISIVGQPWKVRIGSAYHYGTCQSGQWTSFALDTNSASDMKNLINNGNPIGLGIGDMTWIQPGTKTTGYNELDDQFPTPPGADVTVLVVNTADLTQKGELPITAFAGFHIDDVKGGSDKYIEGHFIANHITPGSGGIGPFYGTYTPPRLAQ